MANGVLDVDDIMMATDAISYGPPRKAREYMNRKVEKFLSVVREGSGEFISELRARYDDIRSGETARKLSALTRRLKSVWETNEVRRLVTLNEMRQAPPVMRRWVMANPKIRKLYHNHGCSGYGDQYVDDSPGKVKNDHYDFRRVTNELYYHDREENTVEFNRHYESVSEEIKMLMSFMNKVSIIDTWRHMEDHLISGSNQDPVSQWNGLL